MASKKLKKALALGIGATLGAKFLGAKAKAAKKLAQVDTGDFGSEMANDTALASAMRKSMLPKKKPATSSGADFMGYGDAFGLGPYDGAKTGKMIKANNGVMVQARGNKLARSRPTKIS